MRAQYTHGTRVAEAEVSKASRGPTPAVWLPTILAGTGADVFTLRLCEGLNARGIHAEITWLPHHAEYLPWTVPVPHPPVWASVAHVNSWLPRRFWPKQLPVVVTVHHLVHDPAYGPFRSPAQAAYHTVLIRPRELRAIREAAAVTAVSGYVRDTVRHFSGRQDISMIHNWVDTKKFNPAATSEPSDVRPFRLFMAGSQTRRKGYDLLPGLVKALGPDFEIRYAGGKSAGISDLQGLTRLGRVSDVELVGEYRNCDAVISLSRYEGFGYTALEALATGKPFLGFKTSALPEVVPEGAGTLVPVDDVEALAAAAHRLRDNLRKNAGMPFVVRAAALDEMAQRAFEGYLDVYDRAIRSWPSVHRS